MASKKQDKLPTTAKIAPDRAKHPRRSLASMIDQWIGRTTADPGDPWRAGPGGRV